MGARRISRDSGTELLEKVVRPYSKCLSMPAWISRVRLATEAAAAKLSLLPDDTTTTTT